jgi:prophage regulatory protein
MTKTTIDANGLRGEMLAQWEGGDGDGPTPEPTPGGAASRAGYVRMLRLVQVLEITGLGKTTIYQLQKGGRFPKGVPMTSHSVRWVEEEIRTWVTQRIHARDSR